jgi:hypothetical protein
VTVKSAFVLAVALLFCDLSTRPIDAQTPARKGAPAPPAKKVPAPAEKRVPYAVGEKLLYDVSWSSYVTAGTLSLTVESKKPSYGSTAYYIVAEAQTTGILANLYTLYYKADTLVDAFSLLPQRGALFSKEGSRQRYKVTTFDHRNKKGLFEMETASKMRKDLTLLPLSQDMLSAFYVLRAISPRPGDRLEIPVSDSGWMYKVTFVVTGPEMVKDAAGRSVSTLKVVPQVIDEGGKRVGEGFSFWLSNDAALKPVRMEGSLAAGRIVIALKP